MMSEFENSVVGSKQIAESSTFVIDYFLIKNQ